MNKYAIIKDGVVVNVIEYASQPSNPPPGFEAGHTAVQADNVSPGFLFANGEFTNPVPPTPLTPEQQNMPILAELAANDLKIIRALIDGDTVRLEAHKMKQAALREKLV